MKTNQQVVDENYVAFKHRLPDLMKTDAGRFAVLRDRQVVRMFDGFAEAAEFCRFRFPDGLCSVQEITVNPVDMGYFSHVMLYREVQSDDRPRRPGGH